MRILETHGYKLALYSQKDLRWGSQKLGTCSDTIRQSGCKIASYAMLMGDTQLINPKGSKSDANPSIVDWLATVKGWYVRGCLTVDSVFAKGLDLKFDGRNYSLSPDYPCIAETNYYASSGVPQHFFVYLPNGNIIDPLDWRPVEKENKYHNKMVSYRWLEPKVKVKPEPVCSHCCELHCK